MRHRNPTDKQILYFLKTYLLTLIPLLTVSLLVTCVMTNQQVRKAQRDAQAQLRQVCVQFDLLYTDYSDRSLTLANSRELLFDQMAGNPVAAYHGLGALRTASSFDDRAADIVLDYDTGKLYSTRGVMYTNVYFSSIGATARGNASGVELMESDQFGARVIECSGGIHYVLLHYPVRIQASARGVRSVNYLFPASAFAELTGRIDAVPDARLRLLFSDGTALHIARRAGVSVLELDQSLAGLSTLTETTGAPLNVQVELHYRAAALRQSLSRMQWASYVLLLGALLISLLVALFFVRRRCRRIQELTERINTDFVRETDAPNDSEYTLLCSAIKQSFDRKSSQLARCKEQIRAQASQMVFSGLISDRTVLNGMLEPAGMALLEEYYAIGCVVTDDAQSLAQLRSAMQCDLYMEQTVRGRRVLCFFAELTATDPNGANRLKLARNLDHLLVELGAGSAHIAVSSVQEHLAMAEFACQEALAMAEFLLVDERPPVNLLWEDYARQSDGTLRLPEDELTALSHILDERDVAAAVDALKRLCRTIRLSNAPGEQKSYWRYRLIQLLITGRESNSELLTDATGINPADEIEFAARMEHVVRSYFGDVSNDQRCRRMIAFIHAHYMENELSAEQVADYIGVDKSHLSRLLRTKMNMTYIEYLTQLRMEEARRLLTNTTLPVKDVCVKVGYLDVSSFRKKFKAYFNQGVLEARRAWRAQAGGSPAADESAAAAYFPLR